MHFSKQRGFTLVELLVVIGIIGILAAILIPAVNTATGIARKNTCLSNQRTWGQAMQQHATEKDYFPGYVSAVRSNSGTEFAASWMVKLFPYVEQNNLWTSILDDPTIVTNGNPNDPRVISLAIATCPSDPAEVELKARASYVVNTGIWDGEYDTDDTSPPDIKANGVCHDLRRSSDNRVDISYITKNDGLTNTLLLSENVNSLTWYSTEETLTGMIWTTREWIKNEAPNAAPRDSEEIYAISKGVDYGNDATLLSATGISGADWLKFARPSSRHNAGVNVVFCGGNGRFLSDEIDWTVYKRLLTTNEAEANHPHDPQGNELTNEARLKWKLPLSEEDLEP